MIKKYNTFINENIKDYLKPLSKDKIIDNLKHLSNSQKIETAFENDISWLIEDMLLKGNLKPLDALYYSCEYGSEKSLNFLLKQKDVINELDEKYIDRLVYKFYDKNPECILILIGDKNITKHLSDEKLKIYWDLINGEMLYNKFYSTYR